MKIGVNKNKALRAPQREKSSKSALSCGSRASTHLYRRDHGRRHNPAARGARLRVDTARRANPGGVDLGRGLPRDGLDGDRSDVDRRSAGPVPGTLCYRTTNARIAHGVRNHSRDDIDCALRATGRRHRRGCARDLKQPIILTVRNGTRGAIRTSLRRRTAAQAPAPRVAKPPARCSTPMRARPRHEAQRAHTSCSAHAGDKPRNARRSGKAVPVFPANAGMNLIGHIGPISLRNTQQRRQASSS